MKYALSDLQKPANPNFFTKFLTKIFNSNADSKFQAYFKNRICELKHKFIR